MREVHIVQYKWAGSWGPFSIKISCGECGLTEGIIEDVMKSEFAGMPVTFESKDWLPNWWRVLWRGGWHAPITTLNGKVIAQGAVLDRGLLAAKVRDALVYDEEPRGNVVFAKEDCKHCKKAKELLDAKGIEYIKYDVVQDPLRARQMFTATKRHIGEATPVTVPQVWLDSKYIGGAEELEKHLAK